MVPVLKRFSNNNLPLPNHYFAGCDKEGEIIAMDDLSKEGLRMVDRLDGLDFEHSSIVMKVSKESYSTSDYKVYCHLKALI